MADHEFMRDDTFKYEVELPVREFFYTCDQIAYLLDMSESHLRDSILFYVGREWHKKPRERLRAVNIAPPDDNPDWRVSETDFIMWMRVVGISFNRPQQPGYKKASQR